MPFSERSTGNFFIGYYNNQLGKLLEGLKAKNIPLIEDVCESHGATFRGKKCGSMGWASNFSFYYAHHMSTIEGGIVSTDDPELYQTLRMFRSHGMVREVNDPAVKEGWIQRHPDLNPDFIFAFPSYNVRSTELNAVLGRAQLPRLDANNKLRTRNLEAFLGGLGSKKFRTDFAVEGSSNYAFTLVIREPDPEYRDRVQSRPAGPASAGSTPSAHALRCCHGLTQPERSVDRQLEELSEAFKLTRMDTDSFLAEDLGKKISVPGETAG
jgi:dTDP-4-amino-4,6-dideoxygalactose transaminase